MNKKLKAWSTGGLSAIVAVCSGILPVASLSVCSGVGGICGSCSGGCFSLFGVFWVGMLYIKQLGKTKRTQTKGREIYQISMKKN
jgi:hypothetical protein